MVFFKLLASVSLSCLFHVAKAQGGLVLDLNFPDPAIIQVNNRWYAFATTNGQANVQIASSDDFSTWSLHEGQDALPDLPSWVNAGGANVWAPDVIQNDAGEFVLYFSATETSSDHHCIGTAISSSVTGPYVPASSAFACHREEGGSIDAAGFRDPASGNTYVVYKVDGNSIGNGGLCNNDVPPIVPTPIMMQRVEADGVSKIGDAFQILDRDERDGPLVEAPSLGRIGGRYVLFFSSSCYSSTLYDVSYAIADAVEGPYTKYGPLYVTGDLGMTAPGGADIAADETSFVWHSNRNGADIGGGRAMRAAKGQMLD
ncbi:glycoside hydrolase family 43 protein [Patellaria atrata CBS 101060]|uniref:Glycoside hydrolase family 43 protein n=1 Tax=Patellaria atrata CBS 101060 TaxID=1346257 RepID=A0A9P4SD54_9PEZI|nr:glycoside hydrolase family 43 protein [Patellaria atrata CBS 101060]